MGRWDLDCFACGCRASKAVGWSGGLGHFDQSSPIVGLLDGKASAGGGCIAAFELRLGHGCDSGMEPRFHLSHFHVAGGAAELHDLGATLFKGGRGDVVEAGRHPAIRGRDPKAIAADLSAHHQKTVERILDALGQCLLGCCAFRAILGHGQALLEILKKRQRNSCE